MADRRAGYREYVSSHVDYSGVARWIVAISGAALAAAGADVMFSVTALTAPELVVPLGLTPCLCGVAFAMIACGSLGLRLAALLLRWIAVAIGGSGLWVMFEIPALGIIELLAGLLCLWAAGLPPATARRVAGIAVACGAVDAIWFLAIAAVPSHGPPLAAAGASLGLIIGGVMWLAEPAAAPLPRAIARLAR